MDWEDCNYQQEPAGGGGRQAENPLAALLARISDFNTEELEALLQDRPTQDDADQASVDNGRGSRAEQHVIVWGNFGQMRIYHMITC